MKRSQSYGHLRFSEDYRKRLEVRVPLKLTRTNTMKHFVDIVLS